MAYFVESRQKHMSEVSHYKVPANVMQANRDDHSIVNLMMEQESRIITNVKVIDVVSHF